MDIAAVIVGGAGLLGAIATFVMHFVLLRNQQDATDRASKRADVNQLALESAIAERTELEKSLVLEKTNINELKRELATKDATVASLEAAIASVKKARDDLQLVLKDHPGALPAAVSSAFDQLRQVVSGTKKGGDTPARDPGGGEAGSVHAKPHGAP